MAFAFVILGVCIVLGVPAGSILLALGLFRRGHPNVCVCGYSSSGLRPGNACPECGGPIATRDDIPRVRWQIVTGSVLLALAGLALLTFVVLLFLMIRQ